MRARWAIVWVVAVVGCGDDASGTQGDAGSDAGRAAPGYYETVAPIVAERCTPCHQEGGIGPFELKTYDQVAALGLTIQGAVNARIMPPWLPDYSGDCAQHDDSMWLSDAELGAINAWVEGGMAEGDRARAPELDTTIQSLADTKTHEAWMTEEYTPNEARQDDYRCFVFDSDLEGDVPLYIEQYEVVPGDTRVVHHVIVYQPNDTAQVEAARGRDDAEAGPGYSCFGGSGVSARMLMNWAPGTPVVTHPAGTGVTVEPGLPLVVQVHYNLTNGAFPDQTRVRLKMTDSVEHPMSPWFYTDGMLNLPPGMPEVVKEISGPFANIYGFVRGQPPEPMTIMGVRAHMHQLGTAMRIERVDGATGQSSCLVDIPHYDFHWQRSYFLKQPVALNPTDGLRVRCVYNTSTRDVTTRWGEGTSDEMCLATFYTIDGEL